MSKKENEDLFGQTGSSKDGTMPLPLDFSGHERGQAIYDGVKHTKKTSHMKPLETNAEKNAVSGKKEEIRSGELLKPKAVNASSPPPAQLPFAAKPQEIIPETETENRSDAKKTNPKPELEEHRKKHILSASEVKKSHPVHHKAYHQENSLEKARTELHAESKISDRENIPSISSLREKISSGNKSAAHHNIGHKKETEMPKPEVSAKFFPSNAEENFSVKMEYSSPKKHIAAGNFSSENATVGQVLQEARVKAKLGIEQVSIKTKIKKSSIEALERDDFNNLPAPVYVNAYVRRLCDIYGIDGEYARNLLDKVKGRTLEYTVPEEILHHIDKGKQVNIEQEVKIKKMILISAGITAVLALMGVAIFNFYPPRKNPEGKTPLSLSSSLPPPKIMSDEMEKNLIPCQAFTMTELQMP